MSKLAHSNDETMFDIEVAQRLSEGELDMLFDRDRGLHLKYGVDKLIRALAEKRGTSLRYPEVRAVCRILAK